MNPLGTNSIQPEIFRSEAPQVEKHTSLLTTLFASLQNVKKAFSTWIFGQDASLEKERMRFHLFALQREGWVTKEQKEALMKGESPNQLLDLLYQEGKIQKALWYRLKSEVKFGKPEKALESLYGVLSLHQMQEFTKELQQFSSQEQAKWQKQFSNLVEEGLVELPLLSHVAKDVARLKAMRWIGQFQENSLEKAAVTLALRLGDAKEFKAALQAFLTKKIEEEKGSPKENYLQEIATFMATKSPTTSFEQFADGLTTHALLGDFEAELNEMMQKEPTLDSLVKLFRTQQEIVADELYFSQHQTQYDEQLTRLYILWTRAKDYLTETDFGFDPYYETMAQEIPIAYTQRRKQTGSYADLVTALKKETDALEVSLVHLRFQGEERADSLHQLTKHLEKNLAKRKVTPEVLALCSRQLEDHLARINSKEAGDRKQAKREAKVFGYLERLYVAYTLEEDAPCDETLYRTEEAKKECKKWVEERTSRGRKNQLPDDRLFADSDAAKTYFIRSPHEVTWMRQLKLHRLASRFNQQFTLENGICSLLCEGNLVPVQELLEQGFSTKWGRIIDQQGRLYTWTQSKGLTLVRNEATEDPERWKDSLPVFKKRKEGKNDYRLVVCTNISSLGNHSWIQLKSPDHVYSVGRFWDPQAHFPNVERVRTLPGYLRAGDLHEFMGCEQTIKETPIQISQKTFEEIKAHIEAKQQEGGVFNLAEENCSTFVQDTLKIAGIYANFETNLFDYLLPYPKELKTLKHKCFWIRPLTYLLLYPLTLVKKIFASAFGGAKQVDPAVENQRRPVISNLWNCLAPCVGMAKTPEQVRTWQLSLEDRFGKGVILKSPKL